MILRQYEHQENACLPFLSQHDCHKTWGLKIDENKWQTESMLSVVYALATTWQKSQRANANNPRGFRP